MKRLILLLMAAFLSCGFALPETPEQRQAREKDEHEWAESVSSRYDLESLSAFLQQTIAEKKSWNGVDLTKPRIEGKWQIDGRGMTSGEWSFSAPEPKKENFSLSFIYDDGKAGLR